MASPCLVTDDGVSIHAPLTGGDTLPTAVIAGVSPFQSTPPSREATYPLPRK